MSCFQRMRPDKAPQRKRDRTIFVTSECLPTEWGDTRRCLMQLASHSGYFRSAPISDTPERGSPRRRGHCATPIVPSSMRDFGKRSNAVLLVNAGEELNQLGDFFFCETRFEPLFVLVYGALGDCERAASRFRKVQRLLAPITS